MSQNFTFVFTSHNSLFYVLYNIMYDDDCSEVLGVGDQLMSMLFTVTNEITCMRGNNLADLRRVVQV